MAQRSIKSFFKVSPPKPIVDKTEIQVNGDEVAALNGKEEKKKKVKRQRIESSESESESTNEQIPIKQEKQSPKLYASPKSKKKKILTENKNEVKSPPLKAKSSTKESQKKEVTEKITKKESPKHNLLEKAVKVEPKEEIVEKEKENVQQEKEDKKEVKVAVTEYNPAKANYDPVKDACWSKGEEVPYYALAKTLESIEATSARLKIVSILSNYYRSVIALTPEDLLPSVYLCLNQLAPAYHSLELGIAETYLMKAIGQCTGRTLAQVRGAAHKTGDLGSVAEQARATQRTMFTPPPLKLRRVFAALKEIAHMTGQASVNKKINKIQSLYVASKNQEAKYLIRSLEGKLRIGLAEQSVLQALAVATALTPPHPGGALRDQPYLLDSKKFTCEWKYDGERAQIHVPGDEQPDLGRAAIFSRNQENNTSKYPDILRRLPSLLKGDVSSCVLDCEAVAYDVRNKQILPFQVLSTRKRKDASEAEIKVQVCVFVFDLLYLNGRALVREPLAQRRRLLRTHFNAVEGEWQFATSKDCSSMEEVQQFLDEAVRGSCEGLMVKTLNGEHAKYDIARRSHNWLKLKKDYLDGVGDTIDVVVIGGYMGRGKRAGVFGGFLLACYDPDNEEYQSICKIGTGFSDEDLQTLSETLKAHQIDAPRNYYRFEGAHSPDAWFAAACVWEIRCADLSLSPAHRAAAGLVDADKGISLRFPRFVRVRDDKSPEQATSARQVAQLYLAQDQVKNQANKPTPKEDDFY
ncbi:hypothetical protein K1T71_012790 [Dendrolimus kikuchii]|uniref:Uncharacterized protein n=1 Tax=Dendrolimus kikuchii TaxID=765133 RepID=A0ACC1CI38_9NEOP|nr:hypothetical protein K1T71_012790 [Dendrolimus kikuchii]